MSTATRDATPRLNRLRIRWAAIGAAIAVTLGAGTIATVDAIQTSGSGGGSDVGWRRVSQC